MKKFTQDFKKFLLLFCVHRNVTSEFFSHSHRDSQGRKGEREREVNCIIKALGLLINRHFIKKEKMPAIEFQMKMSTLVSIVDCF